MLSNFFGSDLGAVLMHSADWQAGEATMSDDEPIARGSGGNGDAGGRVAFDYIKSQHFRVIRADGIIGGLTPSNLIHMAFFSERPAIPRRLVYKLEPSGELGAPIDNERISRDSIVREMDVDLFVNLTTAISIHQWLGERIAELQARTPADAAKS